MNQKTKAEAWTDETGRQVPMIYLTPAIKLRERNAAKILAGAIRINKELAAYKEYVNKLCNEVYEKVLEELKASGKNPNKSYTWYNFDRSVKIEVSMSERIDFDDITILACKQKLDAFLDENIDSKMEFVKELVTDAFSTSRGKIDSKKVMSLMKYRTKIKHPLFLEAMDLLTESIRRPDSKTYFRVWNRNEKGEYQSIDLNFSSI